MGMSGWILMNTNEKKEELWFKVAIGGIGSTAFMAIFILLYAIWS